MTTTATSPQISTSITAFGDGALRIDFSSLGVLDSPLPLTAARRIREAQVPGATDVSHSYTTVLVHYDAFTFTYAQMASAIEPFLEGLEGEAYVGRTIRIPVAYGGEFGPDLAELAALKGMSEEEVVALHTAPSYLITTIGFMPGFAYLSGLDPKLETPRRSEPRLKIPAGSVGIAGSQTGIYPLESPGGWQIIGRSPIRAFDPDRTPAVPYEAGDHLQFFAIDAAEFARIESEVTAGAFDPQSLVIA